MITVVRKMLCDLHQCFGWMREDDAGPYWVCKSCGMVVR